MIKEKNTDPFSEETIKKRKRTRLFVKICMWVTVVGVFAFSYIPFYIMLIGSLKSIEQFMEPILLPSFPLRFVNYRDAFNVVLSGFLNSLLVSGAILVGTLLVSTLTAYAFARFRFLGKNILYALVIMNMTIPSLLTLVPQYLVTVNILHLDDSFFGIILPGIAGGQIMGIFLTRTFIENLPSAIFEAAKIDGAGEMTVFFKIAVPLVSPILITVSLMNILGTWNDIVWPNLIIDSPEKQTIAIKMLSFNGIYGSDMGKMFAAYTLAAIPLLVVFAPNMKLFMNSVAVGSVKG